MLKIFLARSICDYASSMIDYQILHLVVFIEIYEVFFSRLNFSVLLRLILYNLYIIPQTFFDIFLSINCFMNNIIIRLFI